MSPQLGYTIDHPESFAGMKVDIGFDRVESHIAESIIQFGAAVSSNAGENVSVGNAVKDTTQHLFDADFITANVIVMVVNGQSTGNVPFNTDHDTTAADLLAALQALTGITSAAITDSPVNRNFKIVVEGTTLVVTSAVTAGATQAVGANTLTVGNDTFRGVALHTHNKPNSTGPRQYDIGDAVNVLRQGQAWVIAAEAVAADDAAHVDVAGGLSRFGKTSGGDNQATGGKFRSATTAAGQLVKLEINLP